MPVIGIDMGGTTVKLGVVENGRDIVYRDTRPSLHEVVPMAETIVDMIRTARVRYPHAPVGISAAGQIDKDGFVDANQLNFWHAPLGPELFRRLGERVPIENDGIAAMLAEYKAGALQGYASCMMLTFGTGIGGGVMLAGCPLRGFRDGQNTNAELGHIITHGDGVACSCGQTGCWEAYASGTALSRMAGGLPPREVVERVKRGEMQELWARYIGEVAQGLQSLLSVFYPQAVALGGGISQAGDVFIGQVIRKLEEQPMFRVRHGDLKIVPAHFQNDAGILGAAALV